MEFETAPHSKLITRAYRMLDTVIDATVALSYGTTGSKFRRATLWNDTDLAIDLTGKRCAITGADSGIGLAAARQLARRGAKVYLLVRNLERGAAAQARICDDAGHSRVYLEAIDLSSVAAVRLGSWTLSLLRSQQRPKGRASWITRPAPGQSAGVKA